MIIYRGGVNFQQIFAHFLFRDIAGLRLSLQITLKLLLLLWSILAGKREVLMEQVMRDIVVREKGVILIYLLVNQLTDEIKFVVVVQIFGSTLL